jgi:hypothetical protein
LAVDLRRGIDAITEVRGIVADDLRRSVNELLRIFFLNSHGFPEDRQLHRARVARLAELRGCEFFVFGPVGASFPW